MIKEYASETSNERLATDRWENEGGHTELAQHRKTRSPSLITKQRRPRGDDAVAGTANVAKYKTYGGSKNELL